MTLTAAWDGTLAASPDSRLVVSDLNTASPTEIAAAGISPALAHAITLLQPYRSWDDVLLIADMDEATVKQLQGSGFQIVPADEAAWAAPKPFQLSATEPRSSGDRQQAER